MLASNKGCERGPIWPLTGLTAISQLAIRSHRYEFRPTDSYRPTPRGIETDPFAVLP